MSRKPVSSSKDTRSFASRTRIEQIRGARLMWSQGMSAARIALHLGVAGSTVHRWRLNDKKRGVDWNLEREKEQRRDPRALIHLLEQQMVDAVHKAEPGDRRFCSVLTMLGNAVKAAEKRLEPDKFEAAALVYKMLLPHVPAGDRGRFERVSEAYVLHLWRDLRAKTFLTPPEGRWRPEYDRVVQQTLARLRPGKGNGATGGAKE